jgi:predicted nucleotidyltransferase
MDDFWESMVHTMSGQLEILQKKFHPIFKRYKVQKAIVFGSFARGEPSAHSDLDLILIQNTDKRFFDRYEGIQIDLVKAAGKYPIDLLIHTPEELEAISHRHFIARALREGKVIYESE